MNETATPIFPLTRSAEITSHQREALAALLALSQSRSAGVNNIAPRLTNTAFGGQSDGGSCTVSDTDTTGDITFVLDPLSDTASVTTDIVVTDVVVTTVNSTIVDWAPIDGYSGGDSGGGDGGDGGDGGGGDGGDSWGPS